MTIQECDTHPHTIACCVAHDAARPHSSLTTGLSYLYDHKPCDQVGGDEGPTLVVSVHRRNKLLYSFDVEAHRGQ